MKPIQERLKAIWSVVAHPYRSLWRATDWLVWDVISNKDLPPGEPSPTVEAYEEFFKSKLRGHWDDCEGMVSPVDTYLAFMPDGEGRCATGVEGMMGGGYTFKWRQKGECLIEVCKEDVGPQWFEIQYSFVSHGGKIKICFDLEGSAPEWVKKFCYPPLPLSGL